MSATRDAYEDVGRAIRQAYRRAREERLTEAEKDVLGAVIELVASYSRLVDQVYLDAVAEAAGRHRKTVARALRRLADLTIVVYVPGRGRPPLGRSRASTASTIGLVAAAEKGAASGSLLGGEKGAELRSEKGAELRSEKGAARGSPTEKIYEKTAEKAAAANGSKDLPDGLGPLLARLGSPLHPSQLQRVAAAWRDDPAHVARSLDEALAGGANPVALFDAKLRSVTIPPGPSLSPEERVRRWLEKYGGGFDEDDLQVIIEDDFGLDAAGAESAIRHWREEAAAC